MTDTDTNQAADAAAEPTDDWSYDEPDGPALATPDEPTEADERNVEAPTDAASDEPAVDTDADDEPTEADAEPATVAEPAEPAEASTERQPLAPDVKDVLDRITTGVLVMPEGKPATAARIAKAIQMIRGGKAPSSGAVAACLARWVDLGFITVTEGPTAFEDYTDEGRTLGLTELKRRRSAELSAARAAKREAASLASGAATHGGRESEAEQAADAAAAPADDDESTDDTPF